MRKSSYLLLCISIMAFNLGCHRAREYKSENDGLQMEGSLLVKDAMKTAREYLKISKDSSFLLYTKAIILAHKYNVDKVRPEIYYRLAMLYEDVSDLKMSAIYLDSALNSAHEQRNFEWVSNTYNALGDLKFSVFDSVRAKQFFDSAYVIAYRYKLQRQIGISIANLSKFEKNAGKMVEMLKSAVQILDGIEGSGKEIGMIYVNLGYVFSNPDSVLKYSKLAVEKGKDFNEPEVEISAYNNMAYSYLEKGEFVKAEECLKDNAIPLAQTIQDFDWLSTLYDTYADVYFAINKPGDAFLSERQALQSRKKSDEIKSLEQVQLLSSLLDLKNKELQIQKKEIDIHQKEKANRDLLFWGSAIIIFISLIASVLIWLQQRKKIRIQNELISSAKRFISLEENLKARVAMDLHDMVTPFYQIMIKQLELAGINNSRVEGEIKAKVYEFTNALRDMSHYMHNTYLDQLTLSELLKGLCNDFRKTAKLNIEFQSNVNDKYSSEITLHLYRISQELLANAFKYANKSSISMSLTKDQKILFLLYSDTGPGFDTITQKNDGIGTRTIIERVKLINGKAILNSSSGEGTEWTIAVPLPSILN